MASEIFIGFSSDPSNLADTIRSAGARIGRIGGVRLRTWEDLRIGGTVLLEQIEDAIRSADLAILDLTQLNENVLFELGIAIGSNRVIWPLRDSTDKSRTKDWTALGLLDTLGQIRFTNSDEILAAFSKERPDIQGDPLFEATLKPQLKGGKPPSIFYMAEQHQTDAGREAIRSLEDRADSNLPLVTADPREASVQTLAWFAQHIYTAEAAVVHLSAPRRQGAPAHNARASLIAGLARGMGKPLLMLAEKEYESALDYKDLLFKYPSAAECRTRLDYWMKRNLRPVENRLAQARDAAAALELSTELRSVDLGEYVAENEARGLTQYYVETASFQEVLSGASRVYIGSKGTGKSAAAMRAETVLGSDMRNLVCSIKPPGYDLEGLVRLLEKFEERDAKGYVAESLWKYLLATELALAVERDLSRRPAGVVPQDPEWPLLKYISENEAWLKTDFAARLESAVSDLLSVSDVGEIADRSRRVSEALHEGPLRRLRAVLGPALAARRRVFIIVDNLDKAWDREAEVSQLSRLLLALLSCMDAFRTDLEHTAAGRGMDLSLSLFIRSDIFATVSSIAREPDKLPVRRLRWPDGASLLDVVEQRYVVSRQNDVPPQELWSRFFCESMGSTPTTDWLLRTCLPRPRDVLYLLRAAVDQAVGHKHARVESTDLRAAEREYSLFAFEAIVVEGYQRMNDIEELLLAFAGVPTHLSTSHVADLIVSAGRSEQEADQVMDVLQELSFLGVLVGEGQVAFPASARDKQKASVLAKRRVSSGDGDGPAYAVHPAFWAYLELEQSEQILTLEV